MDARTAAKIEALESQLQAMAAAVTSQAAEIARLREERDAAAEQTPLYAIDAILTWNGKPYVLSSTLCDFIATVWGKTRIPFWKVSEAMIGAGEESPDATVKSWARRANEWAAAEQIPDFPVFSTKGDQILATGWPKCVSKAGCKSCI